MYLPKNEIITKQHCMLVHLTLFKDSKRQAD